MSFDLLYENNSLLVYVLIFLMAKLKHYFLSHSFYHNCI
jgi:hypothetical protein